MNRLPKHTKIQPEEQGVLISPSYSTRPGATVDRDPRPPPRGGITPRLLRLPEPSWAATPPPRVDQRAAVVGLDAARGAGAVLGRGRDPAA